MKKLKSEYAEKLLKSGIEPYSVVRHSYTKNRMNGKLDQVQNTDRKLSPTLDTRCDCLGVVVKRFKNYISWRDKKGNFNTECNRTSLENDLSLTIPTNDLTKVAINTGGIENMENLRIRKLIPFECLKLMGFTKQDYENMRKLGMSDSAIYHVAGDSIITTCLVGIFAPFVEKDHAPIIENYVETEILNDR